MDSLVKNNYLHLTNPLLFNSTLENNAFQYFYMILSFFSIDNLGVFHAKKNQHRCMDGKTATLAN